MCHMSGVMCHMSGVMCQVSRVRCHFYFFIFCVDQVEEIVGGGSVINGIFLLLIFFSFSSDCKKIFSFKLRSTIITKSYHALGPHSLPYPLVVT